MTRRKVHSPKLIHYYAKASTTSLTRSRVSKFLWTYFFLGTSFCVVAVTHLSTLTLIFGCELCLPKLFDDEGVIVWQTFGSSIWLNDSNTKFCCRISLRRVDFTRLCSLSRSPCYTWDIQSSFQHQLSWFWEETSVFFQFTGKSDSETITLILPMNPTECCLA